LTAKKEVLNLRKGFYLIIPPRYSSSLKLPAPLYVDKLFNYLQRTYYLGLYSASKMYGASHQQTQRDYLIMETPKLNDIERIGLGIQFFTTAKWPPQNIVSKKSDAGIYRMSSPALTFLDLIHHHTKIGGLNRMLASLEELTEELTEADMTELASWYNHKSTLQRAGFVLEELIGGNAFADILTEKLNQLTFYPILLSPKKNKKPGSVNNRWKVDVNLKLESDL